MDAMFKAYKYTTGFTKKEVTILLEKGDHVVTEEHHKAFIENFDEANTIDKNNPTFNLTIKPLDCSDVLNSNIPKDSYGCRQNKNEKTTTVYNKIGQAFHILVPNSLTFEGITIDAINSY